MSGKLKVVFCAYDTTDGSIGGPIVWAIDLIKFLKSAGVDTTVFVLRHGGTDAGTVGRACGDDEVPVMELDTSKVIYLDDQVEWILHQVKNIAPDLVIANLVLPAMYATKFLRPAGIKTITVLHSDPSHDEFYNDILNHLISSEEYYPDVTVSVAEFIDEALSLIPQSQGIRREIIACGCPETTHIASAPRGQLNLIYAGRLVVEQKQIRKTTEALIRATEKLDVFVTICGDGPERDWVAHRIVCHPRVKYVGQLSAVELHDTLANHHIFVLLSDYEGLPIALAEAMAIGLVPICLEGTKGVSEIVHNSQNGCMVADRGETFLAAVESLGDDAEWRKLSEAAQQTVSRDYVHSVTFAKWLYLLESSVDSEINVQRIPYRVTLPQLGASFAGYPRNRPTRRELRREWWKQTFIAIRLLIRPRARLRKAINYIRPSKYAD